MDPLATNPPFTPREIAGAAAGGDLDQAYKRLSDVYKFFVARSEEAPGEYKALHMTLLFSQLSLAGSIDKKRLSS